MFSFLKDFLTTSFSDLVDWPSPFDMLGARMSGVCSVIQYLSAWGHQHSGWSPGKDMLTKVADPFRVDLMLDSSCVWPHSLTTERVSNAWTERKWFLCVHFSQLLRHSFQTTFLFPSCFLPLFSSLLPSLSPFLLFSFHSLYISFIFWLVCILTPFYSPMSSLL